jgi:hypothetical protein
LGITTECQAGSPRIARRSVGLVRQLLEHPEEGGAVSPRQPAEQEFLAALDRGLHDILHVAAAARGRGGELAVWDSTSVVDAVSRDLAVTYAAAAADVLEAFAADDVLTASFALPEFSPGAMFPGAMAMR